jgi:hypothetical protein
MSWVNPGLLSLSYHREHMAYLIDGELYGSHGSCDEVGSTLDVETKLWGSLREFL